MSTKLANQFDYTLIIDRSGSMGSQYRNGQTRYEAVRETVQAFAAKLAKIDQDGFDLYTFSSKLTLYEGVNSAAKVQEIFDSKDPNGSTDLAGVLNHYLQRRKAAFAQTQKPGFCLVITDGEPDDKAAVARLLVDFTKQMKSDEELTLLFIQIGDDPGATKFLKGLDEQLTGFGAKFDIVDVKTAADAGNADDLTDLLLEAIVD